MRTPCAVSGLERRGWLHQPSPQSGSVGGFAVAGAASCAEYAGRAEQRRSDPGLPGCHGCRPALAMQGHGGKVSLATWPAAVSDWRSGKRPAIADIPGTTMTLTHEAAVRGAQAAV